MKYLYYKVLPFLSSFLLGGIFLWLSMCVDTRIQNFLQGISASLIAIPFVFCGYEYVKHISQRKLKRELFELAKMQVDTELLSILRNFYKIFFPIEEGTNLDFLERMLHTKYAALYKHLSSHKFLGFQIKKSSVVTLTKIDEMLHNEYFLKYLDDDQVIALVRLYKTLNSWNALISKLRKEECFNYTGESSNKYQIISSKEKPNRLLLLKRINKETGIVCDFGDFEKSDMQKLLCIYKINPDFLQLFTGYINNVFTDISHWIKLTGKEFLINPQEFRLCDATKSNKATKK